MHVRLRALLFCIVVWAAAPPACANPGLLFPGREIALSEEEVKDSFFAYVIGVIRSGIEVRLSNADLREILTEFKTSLDLPFDLISSVVQHRVPEASYPDLQIAFNSSVKIPIPFAFLGYHPGSIFASEEVLFTETRPLRSYYLTPQIPDMADAVYVMRLSRGAVLVDVDSWLEWLLPSLIQDTIVDIICIFHNETNVVLPARGHGPQHRRSHHPALRFHA
jgi:hypothetical protein